MTEHDIIALLDLINARHGAAFALVARCGGGTHGAYEVAEPAGRRAILKFGAGADWRSQLRRTMPIAKRLLAAGYPIPRLLYTGTAPDGTCYTLQAFVPGRPMDALTPANLELLLDLNDRQANLSITTDQDWSSYVRRVVFADESGWSGALRRHSPAGAALLTALQTRATPYADVALPVADLVHGDFLPDNVLVCEGRVTAVIDIAQAGRGTRAIDLARLLVWSYDDLAPPQRDQVYAHIRAVAGAAGLIICLVEQVLDLTAYAIANRPPEHVEQAIRRGRRVLSDLAASG